MTYRLPKLLVASRMAGREKEFKRRQISTAVCCPFYGYNSKRGTNRCAALGLDWVCYQVRPTKNHPEVVDDWKMCHIIPVISEVLRVGTEEARKLYILEDLQHRQQTPDPTPSSSW